MSAVVLVAAIVALGAIEALFRRRDRVRGRYTLTGPALDQDDGWCTPRRSDWDGDER